MGEAKRRREALTDYERTMQALARKMTDDGRLVEAGWVGLRAAWVSPEASDLQVAEMRKAFMAGAQHLFTSIMHILDEDREPTAADLARMSAIDRELTEFGQTLLADLPVEGRG